mgnify:CR=1 FL=1
MWIGADIYIVEVKAKKRLQDRADIASRSSRSSY